MISRREFERLCAEGYTHIPLTREVPGSATPVSAYRKLADVPYSFLLESAIGGTRWGRYSIIGLQCSKRIEVYGGEVKLYDGDEVVESAEVKDPLAWIEAYSNRFCSPHLENLPRFTGGLVGYFAYDTVVHIERHLTASHKRDDLETPDILLLVADKVAVFDNLENRLYFIMNADVRRPGGYAEAERCLDALADGLQHSEPRLSPPAGRSITEADFVSNFGARAYQDTVKKAHRYIVDGDVMQVVVSQRMSAPFDAHPLACYRALRDINPSPYMYYLDFNHFHVVGSSPEILVRVEDDEVTVRPIAGTRPCGDDAEENERLERDLLGDEKELAEHLMLIDLGRNDIGRICEVGSVKVTRKMAIERYSHVMHIVSDVTGRKRDNVSLIDVLRATFPAGTVSGAPKVRAMELINEFEKTKRGIYSGAIGYLSWSGAMDTAIAIRTALIKDNTLHAQAGAGLVYDSKPEKEWEETVNKARVVMRAAEIATAHPRD